MENIVNALYLVATPIGNLGDITYRAVYILNSVDMIMAEDTRTSSVLLRHYSINTPIRSYHSHNIPLETPKVISRLKEGKSIALISDAGTPGISDPGYKLVSECYENNIRVIPIPGASAFLAALTASGLPTQSFVFEGFFPHKKGRNTRIDNLKEEKRTIILYESPHRIEKTLKQLLEKWGNRKCILAREITKKFEEFISGTFEQVLEKCKSHTLKGEMVLIIEGMQKPGKQIDER